MKLFYNKKPRAFHHPYIYIDERKERALHIKKEAINKEKLKSDKKMYHLSYKDKITFTHNDGSLKQRYKASYKIGWSLLLLIGLIYLWYALLHYTI
jgi:hypothetical protein